MVATPLSRKYLSAVRPEILRNAAYAKFHIHTAGKSVKKIVNSLTQRQAVTLLSQFGL